MKASIGVKFIVVYDRLDVKRTTNINDRGCLRVYFITRYQHAYVYIVNVANVTITFFRLFFTVVVVFCFHLCFFSRVLLMFEFL